MKMTSPLPAICVLMSKLADPNQVKLGFVIRREHLFVYRCERSGLERTRNKTLCPFESKIYQYKVLETEVRLFCKNHKQIDQKRKKEEN